MPINEMFIQIISKSLNPYFPYNWKKIVLNKLNEMFEIIIQISISIYVEDGFDLFLLNR